MTDSDEITLSPASPARRTGQYQHALSLIEYYVQLTWLIFGAFLLTETVILAAVASTAKDEPSIWAFGGALLGLALALPWWASFRYNHALYLLRVAEARQCEPDAGDFFTHGHDLIKGKWFRDPKGRKIRIPFLARTLSPARAVTFLIVVFVLVFLLIAVTNSPWRNVKETENEQPTRELSTTS